MTSKYTIQQLCGELSRRGLHTTGRRPALAYLSPKNKSDNAATGDEEAAPSEIIKNDRKATCKRKAPPLVIDNNLLAKPSSMSGSCLIVGEFLMSDIFRQIFLEWLRLN